MITAALVTALRHATDEPMMRCKDALVVSGGDLEAAKEWLRTGRVPKSLDVRVSVLERQVAALMAKHG